MTRLGALAAALLAPSIACAIAVVALPGASSDRGPIPVRTVIVDRNGVVLATTSTAASVFANPRHIRDAADAAARLSRLIPGVDESALRARLRTRSQFVWIARWVPDAIAQSVGTAHLAGVGIRRELVRQYPLGRVTSHVVGYTDLDSGLGRAGIESFLDQAPVADPGPLRLTIDSRVQRVVWDELHVATSAYKARAAAGLVLDVRTGAVLASVSLPDFDPNDRTSLLGQGTLNKVTSGVYEIGGVFGMFAVALALEQHRVTTQTLVDVTHPLRVSATTLLKDEQPSPRPLPLAAAFARSSLIGEARVAQLSTPAELQSFLERLGLLAVMPIETGDSIPKPLYRDPRNWDALTRTTIGYGYGISVTPLQAAAAASALVNGGVLQPPTLLLTRSQQIRTGSRVVSSRTSRDMRALLRDAVLRGTASQADVPGYAVGGKTGTSATLVQGHYDYGRPLAWFFCAFPMEAATPGSATATGDAAAPQKGLAHYALFLMLDSPQAGGDSNTPATAQWNVAPTAGRIVKRIGSLLAADGGADSPTMTLLNHP